MFHADVKLVISLSTDENVREGSELDPRKRCQQDDVGHCIMNFVICRLHLIFVGLLNPGWDVQKG
jgi:hypothetical protein